MAAVFLAVEHKIPVVLQGKAEWLEV